MKFNPIYLLVAIALISINIIPNIGYCKSKTDSSVVLSDLSKFDGISISSSVVANIVIKEGAKPEVKLSGSYEAFEYYRTKVTDNILIIGIKKNSSTYHDMTLYADITLPSISDLHLSGASDMNISGLLNTDKLNIITSGASNVTIDNMKVTKLDVSASGSSDIVIKNGTATTSEYALSGSSDIWAYKLVSKVVVVKASGASDCKVNATFALTAALSGSTTVKYKGHPTQITESISGGGELKRVD